MCGLTIYYMLFILYLLNFLLYRFITFSVQCLCVSLVMFSKKSLEMCYVSLCVEYPIQGLYDIIFQSNLSVF